MQRIRRPCLTTILAAALAVAFALTLPAAAQEPMAEFAGEAEVNEVLLDVLVTDEKGQVVLGLDEDDFIVREEGEPVELTDVTFYSNRRFLGSEKVAAELGVRGDEIPVNRYFILFFHDQDRLLPRLGANLMDAGRRAEQWARSELLPNDYVAVASYGYKLNVQDFTNDPEAIAAAIDDAIQGRDFSPRELDAPAAMPSIVEHLPEGDADRIYEALAMTAEAAGHVRGRKNLVLFSIGFGIVDDFGFYRPDTRYYPEMVATLNDNNVAVYPIDLLSLDVSPFFRNWMIDNVLSQMADETGGRFYYSFTNYLTPLERIAEDNNGYYLLSYTSRRAGDEGYHEVDVETRNANFRTRSREGYVIGKDYAYGQAAGAGR